MRTESGHEEHQELPLPELRDDLPRILDALAEWLDTDSDHGDFDVGSAQHEKERLQQGLPVHGVVTEYALLRRCLFETLNDPDAASTLTASEVRHINWAFDQCIVGAVRRYTHFRDQRAAVRHAELDAILEGIPDALYVGDASGIFLANRRALSMLGFHSVEELNRHIGELASRLDNRDPETGERIPLQEEGFMRALRGEASVTRVWSKNLSTGEDVIVRCAAAPIHVDGSVVGAVAINTDITERVEAERERELLLGALGHDLRGPLQSIGVGLDMLQEMDDEGAREPLLRMKQSLIRMSALITQLMEFARSRAGMMTLDRQPMELCGLIKELVAEVSISHPDRQIRCNLEEPVHGRWDRDRLGQVVHNLLGNALCHGSPDAPIEVACTIDGHDVLLSVHNDGPPIPDELRPNLFEPFRRGARGKGAGLGLYITCEITRAHGGTIDVESSEDAGTTFFVTLPRGESSSADPSPAA